MSYNTTFHNINPESDELPPPLPLFMTMRYTDDIGIFAGTIYSRTKKRGCVNCGLLHSSYKEKENAYCLNCTQHGKKIFYWFKKIRNVRHLINSCLVANIISRRLHISELGIVYNIIKFL